MNVLLDTSVLVGVEQGRLQPEAVPSEAAVSAVTLAELWLGVLLSPPSLEAARRRTHEVVQRLYHVLTVDAAVARVCAEIRAEGRARRAGYAPFDSLIGATARVHGLPLYTRDEGMVGMLGVDVRVV